MGGTLWRDDLYAARSATIKSAGYSSAFTHDADVKAGKVSNPLNKRLDPNGVKYRESRDSDVHPITNAIGVLFDVTGSMGEVPKRLREKLPKLLGVLLRKNYLEGPQVLFGAIGDATCDDVPLQVGQFESGVEMDEDLSAMYLEGGGGGQITESYELGMYFMARHTSIDCYEKRGKKGYLFLIGDEKCYPFVKKSEVESVIGEKLQSDIPVEDIVAELKEKYEVFYIIPQGSSYFNDKNIFNSWSKLFGQNVIKLEDPSLVCEAIAAIIGEREGISSVDDTLKDIGLDASKARSLSTALSEVVGDKGLSTTLVSSKLSLTNKLGVKIG